MNRNFNIKKVISYFQRVTTSEKHIYVSYYDISLTELGEILDHKNHAEIDLTKIMAFTWSREWVTAYQLKGGVFPQIAVDKFDTRIYSINLTATEGNGWVYFELE